MSRLTDIRPIRAELFFLPVNTRMPLKFGPETLTSATLARVKVTVTDRVGRTAEGWGETPLSVQWVWPSTLSVESRLDALKRFCVELTTAWATFAVFGHPMEVGHEFIEHALPRLLANFNAANLKSEISNLKSEPSNPKSEIPNPKSLPSMPWLAALVCCSAFDIALHDAFGKIVGKPIYDTYTPEFLSRDLASFLTPAEGVEVSFAGKYPRDFLIAKPPSTLPAWHLVGGLDPLDAEDLKGNEPDDGYPVKLRDWIRRDELACLKIKLRGNDIAWDYQRIERVGEVALNTTVDWLTVDFNCTVTDPAYVNDILDRLRDEHPRLYGMILYVEQPFPYELAEHPIDVHSVSARKPLFMDESAHDWKLVKLGRSLGWTGVALKTCKTQTGAILSACWAKAHGMTLMVQDLTNPALAMIPHVLLAAHTGTIMGVETNAMQFYPDASKAEEAVHPGLYRRRGGRLDLSSIRGPGFGYRVEEIVRHLPAPAATV